ncbi:MAG TPA: hypothetical protein VNC39_14960 [Acidocella sp.]|uniref:hypothetical protein n=1 Tax=Acidocella sp. TaxID=50710 RepID=UPI002CA6A1A9|nr:hypothetical protein [Acidocella sp.]HVE23268.1 hypothetical protein [Acidocella sp.]
MTSLQTRLDEHLKAHLYVTGGASKSLAIRLQEAEFLFLVYTPRDANTEALVAELTDAVAAQEKRRRPRGPKERQALEEAVAAVVGGVLLSALRRGKMVLKSRREEAFRGHVGYSAAIAAIDGLAVTGFLLHHSGIRFERQDAFNDVTAWAGWASRYEASDALIHLAASYGINKETVKRSFGTRFPLKAEVAKTPMVLKQFESDGGASLSIPRSDQTHKQLKADVQLANRLLAAASWSSNCQPPALFRTFRDDWTFGGRWIVSGEASIQRMAAEDRLEILIDGQAVAEIDARGSQLSIVAAIAGVQAILGDPYQIGALAAFERDVVKAALTATLGTGTLRKTWPKDMKHDEAVSMPKIRDALVSAHPYLRDLSKLLGVPSDRVSLRLQNIEAQCLTHAMRTLWAEGTPVVPMHDGLLVPVAAAGMAEVALREGYRAVAGAIIQTTQSVGGGAAA